LNDRITSIAAVAVIALTAVLAPLAIPALAVGAQSIVGTVTNGTQGAAVPDGLEITVAQLTSEGDEVARQGASVSQGRFRSAPFTTQGTHFVVGTTYRGVTYSAVADATEEAELNVDLKIFETTSDESAVSITSDTMTIVSGDGGAFEILQLITVLNSSDTTFTGPNGIDPPQVVRLPVASGGFELSAGEGIVRDRIVSIPGGIATGDPLQPGETSFSYAYKVRSTRGGWALTRTVFYDTSRIDLLLEPKVTPSVQGFRLEETKKLGARTYSRYRSDARGGGEDIDGQIVTAQPAETKMLLRLGIGLAVLFAMITGGSLVMRRKRAGSALDKRQDLIEQIASLDERFDTGEIEEDIYRDRRETLKERLTALTESSN